MPRDDGRLRVYFAAPLFTQQERRWNRQVAEALAAQLGCEVILPQDFARDGRKNDPRHFGEIFRFCLQGVERCDVVVAVLDGADADSGTAFEMGYAFALGKPVVGVRTDFRRQQERGTNIMLSRSCQAFVRRLSFNEDVGPLVRELARKVRRIAEALKAAQGRGRR